VLVSAKPEKSPPLTHDLNQIQRGIQVSISQNPASAAEDGLSPTLLMIEEFSHRALNDYMGAIFMLRGAANEVGDSAARTALGDAAQCLYNRAQTFHALKAPRGQGLLDLADYLDAICEVLSTSCLASAGIRLTLIRENVHLPVDQCWCLGLAVTELIMNAARHGLRWEAGDIRVEMSLGDFEVCCTVTDNGCPVALPGIGCGRRIISALVACIGGQANWSFGPSGVCAALQIPRPSSSIHEFAS
jgi:two-component sensor histidine kinase